MTKIIKTQVRRQSNNISRIAGLDLARFVAFVGMVMVNFALVISADISSYGFANSVVNFLSGKAAATFVVLAGIGLALAGAHHDKYVKTNFYRAIFLFILGLANSLIFPADIIHYYAVYFVIASLFLSWPTFKIIIVILIINIAFIVMLITLDYDAGWDLQTSAYLDFWSWPGFARNLFFNGWHPVIPWLSFLLLGLIIAKLDLTDCNIQNKMLVTGVGLLLTTELLNLTIITTSDPKDWLLLFTTSPIPPLPVYMICGFGAALTIIAACLKFNNLASGNKPVALLIAVLIPAGRQSLSLYIGHIIIGMGILEALGMFSDDNGNSTTAIGLIAAVIFCVVAVIFSYYWQKAFKNGPVETIMRRLTG